MRGEATRGGTTRNGSGRRKMKLRLSKERRQTLEGTSLMAFRVNQI